MPGRKRGIHRLLRKQGLLEVDHGPGEPGNEGSLFDIEIRKRRLRPQRLHPDRRLLVFCVRLP